MTTAAWAGRPSALLNAFLDGATPQRPWRRLDDGGSNVFQTATRTDQKFSDKFGPGGTLGSPLPLPRPFRPFSFPFFSFFTAHLPFVFSIFLDIDPL